MKRAFWIAVVVVASALSPSAWPAADAILVNGRIVTVDDRFTIAQAIAIKDGRIVAVGKTAEIAKLADNNTKKIDLKGKTVIPGLINTHVHLESPGAYSGEIPAAKRRTFFAIARAFGSRPPTSRRRRSYWPTPASRTVCP